VEDLPRHPASPEPTLADVEREFPYWHCWRGVAGLLYARRLNSSPPIVVRAENPVNLRDQIRGEIGRRP
jgi:hypothetical protein